jgi:hypothetical protein
MTTQQGRAAARAVQAQSDQRHAALADDAGSLDFTPAEVKQLWWFNDGSIMEPETRHHLWRSWGLCPRHAWGYAVVENEVRRGRPFSTAILYADLSERAARLAGRRLASWRRTASQLAPHDYCFTCDYLGVLSNGELTVDREQWVAMTPLVNRRKRTGELIAAAAELWETLACPSCLGGTGLVCRPHLIAGAEPDRGLAGALRHLSRRLERFVDSMTALKTAVTPRERASWIEALGWFTGWDYPAKLLAESGPARER